MDKENLCGNAAAAAASALSPQSPRQPWRGPWAPANRRAAAAAGAIAVAAREQQQPQPLPYPLGSGEAERGGRERDAPRAAEGASVPARAGAAAPARRRRAGPPVQLSAWKLRQLSAASRSQHARERKLMRAIAAGREVPGIAGPARTPAAAAEHALLRSPAPAPAGAMLPPPPQPGRQRSGGGAPGGSGGRAEGRLAVASGRVSRGGALHSPVDGGSRGGREIVMGVALSRACTLLFRERVTDWGEPPASSLPFVH